MAPEAIRGTAIRAARPEEAAALSSLALRSKAHWGYGPDFIEACRAELTISATDVESAVVVVLEHAGRTGAFYVLRPGDRPDTGDLDFFYVDPDLIGAGLGRRLWRHMVGTARGSGYHRLTIDSDPHAEGFYRAMGARRVGEVPSGSIPGRSLPLLVFELDDSHPST
ncbi:MAG: GNAT family N-acetyltransferase [Acidobacteriota bacterium]